MSGNSFRTDQIAPSMKGDVPLSRSSSIMRVDLLNQSELNTWQDRYCSTMKLAVTELNNAAVSQMKKNKTEVGIAILKRAHAVLDNALAIVAEYDQGASDDASRKRPVSGHSIRKTNDFSSKKVEELMTGIPRSDTPPHPLGQLRLEALAMRNLTLNNEAYMYRKQGDMGKAYARLKAALEVAFDHNNNRQIGEGEHDCLIATNINICVVLSQMG
jgi:hypothetical protein